MAIKILQLNNVYQFLIKILNDDNQDYKNLFKFFSFFVAKIPIFMTHPVTVRYAQSLIHHFAQPAIQDLAWALGVAICQRLQIYLAQLIKLLLEQ